MVTVGGMGRWTASLVVLAALLLPTAAAAAVEVGDVPPSYLGKDRKGKKVNLEDLRGKVVIVTFWAIWCAPCRKELPVLETLQQHAGDRVRVIGINIQDRTVYRPIKRRLREYTMTLINDYNGRTKRRFGVKGIPHLVMIGKDGTVAAIKRGYSEAMVPGMIDEVNALMRSEFAPDAQVQ